MMYLVLFLIALHLVEGYSSQYHNCNQTTLPGNRLVLNCHGLTKIPQWLPNNTYSLGMSGNKLTSIPNGAFKNLKQLNHLIMSNCQLSTIERDAFHGLGRLLLLDISSNVLHENGLPDVVFKPLISLQNLKIHSNDFKNDKIYPDHAISYLTNLSSLSIDVFTGGVYGEGFGNLQNLHSLILYGTDEEIHIENETFTGFKNISVKHLSINLNFALGFLNFIGKSTFQFLPRLSGLLIEARSTSSLKMLLESLYSLQNRTMDYIHLHKCNRQTHFDPISITKCDFRYLSNICVKSLNLGNNLIKLDSHTAGAFMHLKTKNCIEDLDISENIFSFDYEIWIAFLKFNRLRTLKIYGIKSIGLRHVNRQPPDNNTNYDILPSKSENRTKYSDDCYICLNDTKNISTNQVDHSEETGVSTIQLPPNIRYINASFLNTHETPVTDVIFHGGKLNNLDLAYATFESCTGSIKGISTLLHLNMSVWNCGKLNPELIRNLTSLKTLEAMGSNLASGFASPRSSSFLKGLKNLQVLKLSKNYLEELPSHFFSDQVNSLIELYLDNNKFQNLPVDLSKFQNLSFVDLSRNIISYFNKTERDRLDMLWIKTKDLEINLVGNRLHCSCETVEFLEWVNQTKIKFNHFHDIMCVGSNQESLKIEDLTKDINKLYRRCSSNFWLIFSAIGVTLMLITLITSIVIYRYRYPIEYFCLRIRMKFKTYQRLEEKKYENDVFVAYSSYDSDWVTSDLYNELHRMRGLQVCLYDKDFLPGLPIADNIIKAIDTSRKVVFVVTKHFLDSSWGNYEMEMTRMHAFQNGRDDMVIVILKDKISVDEMPKVLQNIWWKIVCLVWTEKEDSIALFWEKLENAISS